MENQRVRGVHIGQGAAGRARQIPLFRSVGIAVAAGGISEGSEV